MKRAVVLLSGGLDSATVLAIAREQGYSCYALSVDYGQRHRAELDAAADLLDADGIQSLRSLHRLCWRALQDRRAGTGGAPTSAPPQRSTEGGSSAAGPEV